MKHAETQKLIEEAYEEYKEEIGLMSQSLWMRLDDSDISPAGLWEHFRTLTLISGPMPLYSHTIVGSKVVMTTRNERRELS